MNCDIYWTKVNANKGLILVEDKDDGCTQGSVVLTALLEQGDSAQYNARVEHIIHRNKNNNGEGWTSWCDPVEHMNTFNSGV